MESKEGSWFILRIYLLEQSNRGQETRWHQSCLILVQRCYSINSHIIQFGCKNGGPHQPRQHLHLSIRLPPSGSYPSPQLQCHRCYGRRLLLGNRSCYLKDYWSLLSSEWLCWRVGEGPKVCRCQSSKDITRRSGEGILRRVCDSV